MNWKELKDFANSLDENQLEQKVILWREDEAITNIGAEQLHDDHYIGEYNDDGCYTLSDAGLTLKEAKEQGLEKVYDKGTPILFDDFEVKI